jgi:hypothetical protein
MQSWRDGTFVAKQMSSEPSSVGAPQNDKYCENSPHNYRLTKKKLSKSPGGAAIT